MSHPGVTISNGNHPAAPPGHSLGNSVGDVVGDALGFAYQTSAAVRRPVSFDDVDRSLLLTILVLMGIGIIMVASASMPIAEKHFSDPLHYVKRELIYVTLGLALGYLTLRIPVRTWQQAGPYLLLGTILLLAMVLVPGVGHQVNGAVRWIALGPVKLQVSELAKLFVIVYLAGYLVRHGDEVRERLSAFVKPMTLILLIAMLLLLEPDFGASAIIVTTSLALLFLGGVKLRVFMPLLLGVGVLMALLIRFEPYRWARMTSFMNPWDDPFNKGFQLTQSLIAIGRGDWFGVGLGNSMQKLLYLPEAHTDFVFAIYAEEFGFIGTLFLLLMYLFLVRRAFVIARKSERVGRLFGSYVSYAIGLWLGMQAFINMAVNMGALPTKGLTLPLLSYGGSSLLVNCIALALLMRIDYERRVIERPTRSKQGDVMRRGASK